MLRTISSCLLALALAPLANATRYHVNLNATGANIGSNWNDAFVDLQSALSLAIPGDEIWVAAGVYKPTNHTDRTIAFALQDGVDLFGGFAGGETELIQRDLANNITVLSGDIGQPGSIADNSHTVVKANNITTTITLDGFRIMSGNSGNGNNGGGVSATNITNGLLIVKNCHIVRNTSQNYGGGIYLAAARLTIENCLLELNQTSGGSGGAICNGNNNGGYSSLTILDSRFTNNTARLGACLYNTVRYEDLVIDRCTFTNNTGSISLIEVDDFSSARMSNSYVIGNTVNDFGGSVIRVNSFNEEDAFSMVNCTVVQNFNLYENGIQDEIVRLEDPQHRVTNCIIYKNTAYNDRQLNEQAQVSYSIIEGGYPNGSNIIVSDPLFTTPYSSDPGNFDAIDYDYTLLPSSPAINVGSDQAVIEPYNRDLAQQPRIQGEVVDLGCYETDQTVAILEDVRDTRWFFDPTRSELHLLDAMNGPRGTIAIHDMSGKLITTIQPNARVHQLLLSTGAYVAVSPERGTLKFVVP